MLLTSGLEDDLFLALSDAKRPDEDALTRVSLLTLLLALMIAGEARLGYR